MKWTMSRKIEMENEKKIQKLLNTKTIIYIK